MKKCFVTIWLTIFAFLLLWTGIELYQGTVDNEYTYKRRYIEEHGREIKTLLMGNSHTYWSLDPEPFGDSCFNCATNARWIAFDRLLLEKYLDAMPNLKTIIYPLGYYIPFVGLKHHFDGTDDGYPLLLSYMHWKYMGLTYERSDRYEWHRTRQEYIGGDKINVQTLICERFCLPNGYQPHPQNVLDSYIYRDTLSVDNISTTEAKENFEEYFTELEAMARICKRANIRLIAVAFPLYDTMKNAITPEAEHLVEQRISVYNDTTACPYEFRDYRYGPEFRADSLWFCCDHLGAKGARLFAKKLKKEFKI